MAKKRVHFHYKGMLDNGTVFVDTTDQEALEIVTETYSIMPELDSALSCMEVGEERIVNVGKAYGEYDEKGKQERILRYTIKDGDQIEEGQELLWTSPNNPDRPVPVRVIRADQYSFDLDFNHPLAGKDLQYWLKLVDCAECE